MMLSHNRYIVAMGPMKSTAEDFWRMIWQENVMVIVMITKLKEGRTSKCHQYWPDPTEASGRIYNEITVKCRVEETFSAYRLRKICLNKDRCEREITQLHFMEWDEMKTPRPDGGFLEFYNKVESTHTRHNTAPLLVQTSCGAGRAGTFIAIHDLLTSGHNRVNVYECVRQLRDCRPEMVQTEAQYSFIYRILQCKNIMPVH